VSRSYVKLETCTAFRLPTRCSSPPILRSSAPRWAILPAAGTMEIWLEPCLDGALLHYFLHAEPSGVAPARLAKLNLAKLTHRRRVVGKKMAFEVKTTLERSRPVGVSPILDQA